MVKIQHPNIWLLHNFKHIQWMKQGIQRQLEIPRGISRYIKAQLLAIYSSQLLCSVVLASQHMLELFAFNSSNEPA